MKKRYLVSAVLSTVLFGSNVSASEQIHIQVGWQLLGSSNEIIDISTVFNRPSINTVWIFDQTTQIWRAYSPDPATMQLIDDSNIVEPLLYIPRNSGFWVNAKYSDDLIIDNNSESLELPPLDENSTFVYQLQDVAVDLFANKNFKIVEKVYSENTGNISYLPIQFDSNGEAQFSELNYDCYNSDENETIVTLKVENGNLNVYANNNVRSYKILAVGTDGIVLGALDAIKDGNVYYVAGIEEPVIYLLNENAVESPQDMANKIPYNEYMIWSASNDYRSYETNGSIVWHWSSGEHEEGTFTIDDNGQIVGVHEDSWYNGGYKDEFSMQTVYSIGNFDINRVYFNGYHYDTVVGYEDENGTWNELNLTANPDIDTWQEFFAATGGSLYGTEYYENNNTTEYGESYTISDDGKVLSVTNSCGYEYNRTIESGQITDYWSGVWMGISSTTPIYNPSSSNPSLKIITTTPEGLPTSLPEYIKKIISTH